VKTAVIFPGQGSQQVGMGRDLWEGFAEVKEIYKTANEVLGFDLTGLSFEGPALELNRTVRTQPALLTASYAAWIALSLNGIEPEVLAGHSLGEYTAVVASGALSFPSALRITEMRGRIMQEAVPEGEGMMAAVLGLPREKVMAACKEVTAGYVEPANFNCPGQIVISGEKKGVEEAMGRLKTTGAKRVIPLQVSVPSHSKLMEAAAGRLAEYLFMEADIRDPQIPIVGNSDAIFLSSSEQIKTALIRQLSNPVLWEDSLRVIHGSGVNAFIEAGPGKVLSGLVRKTLPDALTLNVEDRESLSKTLQAFK
jgi:[acyl-carrier-protein] S-malonyltransferase